MQEATRLPGGYSLPTWQQHARRDDCLDRMVPSDLRQFLGLIERQQQVIDLLMKAVEPFKKCIDGFDTAEVDDEEIHLILLGSDLTAKDLRRAREAKVESEKILNSTSSTAL